MKRKHREPIVLSQMRPMTLLLVLCGCILFTFCLIHIAGVLTFIHKILSALGPVIAGFVFAYLLNPVSVWVERRLSKLFARVIKKHPRMQFGIRCFSAFFVVLLFIGSLTLLVFVTFSQVVEGISTFLDKLPHYFDLITTRAEQLLSQDSNLQHYFNILNERFSATEFGMGQVDTVDMTQKILSALASGAVGTLGFLYNVIVGFVIAVYILVSRERFIRQWKQVLYAVVKPKTAKWIDTQLTSASHTFSTAVLGKIVDSILIGMLCFIGNTLLGLPYAVLIAVIVGITNMIPYFGPILGAIPCVLLVLMENPLKALYFLIFIVALQQIDCNILDPHIVGKSIGLPAFWELFACLLGGGLFGLPGLVISVPAFAVLYGLIRQLVTERLDERGRDHELEPEFLRDTLGLTGSVDESGLFEEDEQDSPYLQHLILLEEIAPPDLEDS